MSNVRRAHFRSSSRAVVRLPRGSLAAAVYLDVSNERRLSGVLLTGEPGCRRLASMLPGLSAGNTRGSFTELTFVQVSALWRTDCKIRRESSTAKRSGATSTSWSPAGLTATPSKAPPT